MNIEKELRAIEEKAKALMEENKTLKAHLLTTEQQPIGLDGYVAKRLKDAIKTPCVSYSIEQDLQFTVETLELSDGTEITIKRESN